jgi:hypothetical protein
MKKPPEKGGGKGGVPIMELPSYTTRIGCVVTKQSFYSGLGQMTDIRTFGLVLSAIVLGGLIMTVTRWYRGTL